MIKLTNLILENNLREYSEEEKKKMGIPSGATSRGGVWYVGDKYAGKVVNNKFVSAEKEQPGLSTQPSSGGDSEIPTDLPQDDREVGTPYERASSAIARRLRNATTYMSDSPTSPLPIGKKIPKEDFLLYMDMTQQQLDAWNKAEARELQAGSNPLFTDKGKYVIINADEDF